MPNLRLRSSGLRQDQLKALCGADDQWSWWGAPFELGRAPLDSKYSAAWHASLGVFAPIERRLAPAPRHMLRARFDAAQGGEDSGRNEEIRSMAPEAVWSFTSLRVSSDEPGKLLRAYVRDIQVSVVRAIRWA